MALETTTTAVNDLVNTAVISQTMLAHAMEFIVAQDKFRYFSLVGAAGAVAQVPRLDANYTVNDNGATLDAEFDATEGSSLGNTQLTTSNVQFTVSEYGVSYTITDNVYEDSILGTTFMSKGVAAASHTLALAVEQASLSLFSSLSGSYGTSNTDLTHAVAMSAADGIRTRGTLAPDGLVYVFDNVAWANLKTAAVATNAAQLVYATTGSQILGMERSASHGLGSDRRVGTFYGLAAYETGITPTATGGVDVVSACFTPSTPANDDHATFAYVEKRPFRMEIERDAKLRADVAVFTRRCAVGEATDFSGSLIISNAA